MIDIKTLKPGQEIWYASRGAFSVLRDMGPLTHRVMVVCDNGIFTFYKGNAGWVAAVELIGGLSPWYSTKEEAEAALTGQPVKPAAQSTTEYRDDYKLERP